MLLSSRMTDHPSLLGIFPGLALKVPLPGKCLSAEPAETTGHLFLPLFVNQINCDHPTRHLREKGYNNYLLITVLYFYDILLINKKCIILY